MEPDVTEFFRALVKDLMVKRRDLKIARKDFIQLLVELKDYGSISVDAEEEENTHLESAEMQSALTNTSTFSKFKILAHFLNMQINYLLRFFRR
jgi:hypothetical protein